MEIPGHIRTLSVDVNTQHKLQPLLHSAEQVLTASGTGKIRLKPIETFEHCPHVVRCRFEDSVSGFPMTVIVKQVNLRGEDLYDPNNGQIGSPAVRFFNEWAGLNFLQTTDYRMYTPRCYGGDRDSGVIIL